MRLSIGAFLAFILSGCAEYSFDINQNEVYTPPTVYTRYSLDDAGLQSCIDQTIKDQNIVTPAKVVTLQCSYSGITTIEGISQFSRIEKLSLKGNDIDQIEELLQLTYLSYLDLSDNPITDCRTLEQLKTLITETFLYNGECKSE